MAAAFPFLTAYDPPGTSEGSLDPLGLYQIADQLAMQLVPAVRERMLRFRFLTAMAVGSLVVEDLEGDPHHRDAAPYLVWEWIVVEALTREPANDAANWGVPGTVVTRTARAQHGYVDARSYLKTPRVFGFHGVYKRLAVHLGLLDVHLAPGPNAERLADAWAQDQGLGGIAGARQLMERWKAAVRRSLNQAPPRTNANWNSSQWRELAQAFAPATARAREKRLLRRLLLATDERQLGALPELWELQANNAEEEIQEERLHTDLERRVPAYGALVQAIRNSDPLDTQVSESDLERAVGVMRRFLRVSTTLVRCFPLDEYQTLAPNVAVERMLDSKDASMVSWRAKFETFVDFLTDHCTATERADYLEAAAGTRTGGIRVDADLVTTDDGNSKDSVVTLANVQVATGRTKRDTRSRLMRAFNTPFFPDIFVCSQVMGEGVDLQRYCRHVVHHDLAWNPSTIEQRTGRVDRLGCKAEGREPISVYLPYLAGAADERQYRVMTEREQWFRVVMGQDEVARLITRDSDAVARLPGSIADELSFNLEL